MPAVVVTVLTLPPLSRADLECEIGWGKLGIQKIPEEKINDGYCDCPLDGADEPHTNACSGSTMGAFTGIAAVSTESKKYQCPQQRKLQIPYSRFHDGICDCCDGSDELPTVCPDICDQVLAEERALREKMAREFTVGQKQREKEILEFQALLEDKRGEKAGMDEKLEQAEERVSETEAELNQVKHEYMVQRVDRVNAIARRVSNAPAEDASNDSLASLLEPLPNHEIIEFIVHSCQMAAEMDRASTLDDSTCVPLRLAALDTGIMWNREKDGKAELKRLHLNVREEGKLLADMMIHNAKANDRDKMFLEESEKRKHRKRNRRNKPGRRRLQEAITDDDVLHDDYYGGDDDPYPEEDYIPDEDYDRYDEGEEDTDDNENDDTDEEVDDETRILNSLKESLFSQPRVAFLQRASDIVAGIDEILKEDDRKDGNKEAEEGDEEKEQDANDMDPTAYNMVRSTLEDREHAIERGFDYAVSAKILLKALMESTDSEDGLRSDLQTLAIGTLVYSKLSAAHVWQLLQAILQELSPKADDGNEARTCASSPWVASCPPQAIVIDSVSFPPKDILDAAQVLCTTPTFTKEKAQACAADADNELPTVMPDGYYGYEVVKPREQLDVLEKIAAEWDHPINDGLKTKVDELEDEKEKRNNEKMDIENFMKDISSLVQGAEDARFGSHGELYALKDKCFDVKAGKYTYELCVFGSAAQKEGSAKSGTGLGQWDGIEYDNQTGSRILKWANGVKCWNGPKRSATAYVTCGAETKVLSADEPDTCRYVMQMESHIACDEDFQRLHEL